MAATNKRLPKELQTFKREMKKATFEEKVERYFSISAVVEKYPEDKRDIIVGLFTPGEKINFYYEYFPIRKAINTYEDKIRTIKSVIDFTAYYIDSLLRIGSIYTYMGEFTSYALQYLKEETGKDNGKTAKHLKSLRSITPGFKLVYEKENGGYSLKSDGFEKKSGSYSVKFDGFVETLEKQIKSLEKGLSVIKAYFNSLREFLEVVEKPQLFPKEFKTIEEQLISRFRNLSSLYDEARSESKETDYPKFRKGSIWEKKVISIDYMETEPEEGFTGDKNPWIIAYKSYLKV